MVGNCPPCPPMYYFPKSIVDLFTCILVQFNSVRDQFIGTLGTYLRLWSNRLDPIAQKSISQLGQNNYQVTLFIPLSIPCHLFLTLKLQKHKIDVFQIFWKNFRNPQYLQKRLAFSWFSIFYNSDEEWKFLYDCHPQPSHQLPFDQRVQIKIYPNLKRLLC